MSIAHTKELLADALGRGIAVGAFNLTSLDQIPAFAEAAERVGTGAIIQVIEPVARLWSPEVVAAVFDAAASAVTVPLALHLDHTKTPEFSITCTALGFSSVMYDGSSLAIEENVGVTSTVVEAAHRCAPQVAVEGEIGVIGGEDEAGDGSADHAAGRAATTDSPAGVTAARRITADGLCSAEDAAAFAKATAVDLLAPAIGTAHGLYKSANPALDFGRIRDIADAVNELELPPFLVVHGGTGLPPATLARLVNIGFVKFNVSTVLKRTLIDTTHEYVSANRDEYDPTQIDRAVRAATVDVVEGWIRVLSGRTT